MLNIVWLTLVVGSVVVAVLTGHTKELVSSITQSSNQAFQLALGFTGVMAFWLGLVRIAEASGLVERFTTLLYPIMRVLFPKIPEGHPAIATMAMNMAANMFGLTNAATPLGLKAMTDLDKLNPDKGTASDEMCMFLAINTSSLQLIPAGAIALLAAGGSSNPTAIVLPALLATGVSTIVGITAARFLSRSRRFRQSPAPGSSDD
ncbi:MAG: nucleoside recognition domain-containing protein [Pseudomonadota bacterium]